MGMFTPAYILTKESWVRTNADVDELMAKCKSINTMLNKYGAWEETISRPSDPELSKKADALVYGIELEFKNAGWNVTIKNHYSFVKMSFA